MAKIQQEVLMRKLKKRAIQKEKQRLKRVEQEKKIEKKRKLENHDNQIEQSNE